MKFSRLHLRLVLLALAVAALLLPRADTSAAAVDGKEQDMLTSEPTSVTEAIDNLDGTFGRGGKVVTDIGSTCEDASAVAIYDPATPDAGKIVAAGSTCSDFALVRYDPDGTVDASFGTRGKVTTDLGSSEALQDVAIQSDGRIVAAGARSKGSGWEIALVRYNTDGTLDGSFGTAGAVTTEIASSDAAFGVALQPDGKIVVAGISSGSGFSSQDFALVRYTSTGGLDPEFGDGGVVTTDFALGDDAAVDLAVQPDGMIVAAGTADLHPPSTVLNVGSFDFALARYTASGSLDPTFGPGGKVTTDLGSGTDQARAVAIHAAGSPVSGKIVVAGLSLAPGARDSTFAVARYNTDGSHDRTFGAGGHVTTDLSPYFDWALDVAITPEDKIVAAGSGTGDFDLVRYHNDGSPDPSFGTGGHVATDFGSNKKSSYDSAAGVAVQTDGKIVAGGAASVASASDFALARYAS